MTDKIDPPTARKLIEARLGRKLPPTRELPRDLRRAVYLLALQLQRMVVK